MAQTATSIAPLLKRAWTSDRIQKQFEAENNPLPRLESVKGTMIGEQAQTPIWNNRSAAYTSVGPAGGQLNPAKNQQVTKATWTLVYSWFQIALEASALMQATGSNVQSVIAAKDLEIEGAIENTRHNVVRELVTNGDGIVAACDTTSSSNTIKLVPAAGEGQYYGYSALVRGWLFPGQTVDIGTTADTDALTTAATITAVNMSETAPTITIDGSAIATTKGTHFVYIPNPNSTTAANPEINGMRQMFNDTGAVGGLNPSTAGQESWASYRDTSTTVLSLDLLLGLSRRVRQNSNKSETDMWFGYKQEANYYNLLQNQIRFSGDGNLGAGEVGKAKWNGMVPAAFADILDTDVFLFNRADLVRITGGGPDKPQWASDIQGGNQGSLWSQGTTQFVDALVWPLQVGLQRRNTAAAATALQT